MQRLMSSKSFINIVRRKEKMISKYQNQNRDSLVEIFKGNIPKYFDQSELDPFLNFLDKSLESYYTLSFDNEIIGAGGFIAETPGDARIVWFMIDAKFHNRGFGKQLFQFLESEINEDKNYQVISLNTSQLTNVFYEKLGYVVLKTSPDYWAPGMHLFYMEKDIS